MANEAIRLLEQPTLRHQLGDEARRAGQLFSTTRAVKEYSARLTQLYERRRARTR
jgi:hypothetical protein